MGKLTVEIREFILRNKKKTSYALVGEIEREFGIKVSYNSILLFRKRQQRIADEYLENTDKKELNLEEMFEMIKNEEKSAFRKYWESTIASAIVAYYKNKKKRSE